LLKRPSRANSQATSTPTQKKKRQDLCLFLTLQDDGPPCTRGSSGMGQLAPIAARAMITLPGSSVMPVLVLNKLIQVLVQKLLSSDYKASRID